MYRGDFMDKQQEEAFSNYLESQNSDKIFDTFQDIIRSAFLEGYRKGKKNGNLKIIYIINKEKAEE